MTTANGIDELEAIFERMSGRLLEDRAVPVERGRMLRASGLKTAGRFFAFTTGGDLVVKLPEGRVNDLVARDAGRPCQIGRGRPMREWVRVRPHDDEACVAYLIEARDFVAGLDDRHARPVTILKKGA
jgi:hypothetical protein